MGCNLRDLAHSTQTSLSNLSGKKVGIDAFLTAFQFLTTMRDRSPTGDGGPLRTSDGKVVAHLMGFLHRTAVLLSHEIHPVYIFDGESPALKEDEIEKRRQRGVEAEEIHKEALANGDFKLAQKMAQRIMHYSPEMVEETKTLLDLLGVPWVDAAAEGEAQAAVMAANGLLDVVATQDWDALLYGSPVLVRNLMNDGSKQHGRIVHAQEIHLQSMLSLLGITREQLVDLGIMIGTDFHPGIKGIGPKTGLKLIKEYKTIEEICKQKGKEEPEQLDAVREIFLNHPTSPVNADDLQLGEVNKAGLIQFLQTEREFSQRRMDQAFEKLQEAARIRPSGQTSLFSF